MGTIALPSVAVRRRGVCVNAAVEINVLDYNVAVRRCAVPYGDLRRRT